jgi:putative CocE/NonD family hydrolase
LEARDDVLCYTTRTLEQPVEIIGVVRLELWVRSSLEHTDFFGRLCDVHPDGRSINICDGFFRLESGRGKRQDDGSVHLVLELDPAAQRFGKGRRIRLLIASAAFPSAARNLGTGESMLFGTRMQAADQTVFHDRERTSALVLPIYSGNFSTEERELLDP